MYEPAISLILRSTDRWPLIYVFQGRGFANAIFEYSRLHSPVADLHIDGTIVYSIVKSPEPDYQDSQTHM